MCTCKVYFIFKMESLLFVANFACAVYVCGRTVRGGCNIQFFNRFLAEEVKINRKYFIPTMC